jgi:hypothetical protein
MIYPVQSWRNSLQAGLMGCLSALLLVSTIHPIQAQGQAVAAVATNAPPAKSLWERIVLIGASASAGFIESEPFGGTNTRQFRLSRYVDAALVAPHQPVTNLATAFFFMEPEATGKSQIEKALKHKPTLVLGVDFPFWFCYGNLRTNETRQQRFEKGLKLLENIPCRLVLGDIPDAAAAAKGMLGEKEIPTPEEMVAANRRLRAWAAGRSQVIIFPLADYMRAALGNKALTVHGTILPAGETRQLIQKDKLHPSALGCATLAVAILDTVQSKEAQSTAADIRWDPKEVFRMVPK